MTHLPGVVEELFPSAVMVTPRLDRWNNSKPISSSRSLTALDRLGWERYRFLAAELTEPLSAMTMTYFSCWSVMMFPLPILIPE